MNHRRAIGILVVSLLTVFSTAPAFAQQLSPSQSSNPVQQTAITSGATVIPSHSDSPGDLKKMFKEMLKLRKKGDTKELAPYVQSLILPNSDAWFRSTFGDAIGAALANDYDRTRAELPISFPDMLADLLAKHHTDPEAIRFTDSCNSHATEYEYPVLILRQNAQPLYDVRFFGGTTITTISYFAYTEGAFRYLGNFQVRGSWPIAAPKNHAPLDNKQVRLAGNVTVAKLIRRVVPVYPQEAADRGIQGTVLFHAIIAKDGSVRRLQLIRGQCFLAQSATKAVSQWRYSPTMLNGEPVQVDTTITVIYNLGR